MSKELPSGTIVAPITPTEVDPAVAVLWLAFSSDPAARWTFAEPQLYVSYFPRIVRAFGGKAFELGTGHQVGGFRGAALWLPPGVHPDQEALGAVMQEALPADRLEDVTSVFER